MANAHKLDCENAAADCRFIIQSEDEDEALALAQTHMQTVHGKTFTEEELRNDQLTVV